MQNSSVWFAISILCAALIGCPAAGRRKSNSDDTGPAAADVPTLGSDTKVGPGDAGGGEDTNVEIPDGVAVDAIDAPDPPPDVGPTDTGGPPDAGPKDTGGPSGGRLGQACLEDFDCACVAMGGCPTSAEHVCLSGFCTAFCQGENAAPGACDFPAAGNPYGDAWACPSDVTICLPGIAEGTAGTCKGNDDCLDQGAGSVCLGVLALDSTPVLGGVCVPPTGKGTTGSPCEAGVACESNVCMNSGVCADLCVDSIECPGGTLCMGIGFTTSDSGETATAWVGACVGIDGPLNPCDGQGDCGPGSTCSTTIEPVSLAPQFHCFDSGPGAPGSSCADGDECQGGSCLFNSEPLAYCSQHCPGGGCPDGMQCQQIALHNNGTLDDDFDDPTYGVCIASGGGSPCVDAAPEWCDSGVCAPEPNLSEGFGVCEGGASGAAAVQALVNTRCTPCHVGGGSSGGMSLDDVVAGTVNVPSSQGEEDRIEPFSLEGSYLWLKVTGNQPSGSQMPLGGAPLGSSELQVLEDWILSGASE